VYLFSSAEIQPKPGSLMSEQRPDVVGAFVHCLVAAANKSAAEEVLREALAEDSYSLLSPGHVEPFQRYCSRGGRTTQRMKAAAWDLLGAGGVWYGPFFGFVSRE
jgi:hypothetical protein